MKIIVPDGMLKAAVAQALISGKVMNRRQWTEFFASADSTCVRFTREILEAALEWVVAKQDLLPRFDFNPCDGQEGMESSPDGDYVLCSDMQGMFAEAPVWEQRVTVEQGDAGWILRKDGELIGDRLSTDVATYAKIGLIESLKREGQ